MINQFLTNNLDLASVALASGFVLENVTQDPTNERHGVYHFQDDPALKDIRTQYYSHKLLIDPLSLAACRQKLTSKFREVSSIRGGGYGLV